jgi:hypothetical protein
MTQHISRVKITIIYRRSIHVIDNKSNDCLSLSLFRSVFGAKHVALLPPVQRLLDAAVWIEAKGRTGSLHAATDAEFGATLLKSQIFIARGQTQARTGAKPE